MDLDNLEKQLDEAIESGPKTLIWFAEKLIVEILVAPGCKEKQVLFKINKSSGG